MIETDALSGGTPRRLVTQQPLSWQEEALELAKTLPQKEAARKIAAKFHMGRRDVYQYLLKNGD